jgi:hypothetical protein
MGITINYEGRLKNQESLDELINKAISLAKTFRWNYRTIDLPENFFVHVKDVHVHEYSSPARGICIIPSDHCEAIKLIFDKDLYMSQFTKTSFAGPLVHKRVVEFLRLVEPLIKDFEVNDETNYWKTKSDEILYSGFYPLYVKNLKKLRVCKKLRNKIMKHFAEHELLD